MDRPLVHASRLLESTTQITWLWQGLIARGKITLLTSQWKSGKTTLVSVLLSKLQTGGELAGLTLAAPPHLIPYGLEEKLFRSDPALRREQRRAWGLGPDEVAVGMLGRQHRIIAADLLEKPAVTRAAAVGDHDVIIRSLLGTGASKTNFQTHRVCSFSKVSKSG